MKHFLLVILCILYAETLRAQLGSRNFIPSSVHITDDGTHKFDGDSGDEKFSASNLPTFGLYGIGNTNTESFKNINAAGKLAGYIRPFKGTIWKTPAFVDVNFAFNMNASNTDSLAVNMIVFPDLGKNSFSGSAVLNLVFGKMPNFYLISPFIEFANKSISGEKEDVERTFYTINSTFGVSLQYLAIVDKDKVSFGISPYIAKANIPDPGREDYRYLLTGDENSPLKSAITSLGTKITFQYNYFQIFADFRSVKGDKNDFPIEGMTGFHSNIGIIFNAEIFEK